MCLSRCVTSYIFTTFWYLIVASLSPTRKLEQKIELFFISCIPNLKANVRPNCHIYITSWLGQGFAADTLNSESLLQFFFVKLFHKICKGGTNKCSAAEKVLLTLVLLHFTSQPLPHHKPAWSFHRGGVKCMMMMMMMMMMIVMIVIMMMMMMCGERWGQ